MSKQSSPTDLLVAIVGKQQGEEISRILDEMGAAFYVNIIGHGTAESGIADMFGFGVVERDVVFGIISSSESERIVQRLNERFKLEERHTGLCFTIPINSVEKKIFDFFIKGEKNGKKI